MANKKDMANMKCKWCGASIEGAIIGVLSSNKKMPKHLLYCPDGKRHEFQETYKDCTITITTSREK